MQPGDQVRLIDGEGVTATGTLVNVGRKDVTVAIDDVKAHGERPSGLVLMVSPTKSTDRFEWLLEKATELGVEAILPIWTNRSVRKTDKHERWAKGLRRPNKARGCGCRFFIRHVVWKT